MLSEDSFYHKLCNNTQQNTKENKQTNRIFCLVMLLESGIFHLSLHLEFLQTDKIHTVHLTSQVSTMLSKRQVTSSLLEACNTKTTIYSSKPTKEQGRPVTGTVSIRHQECTKKTNWKVHLFVGSPSTYVNGNHISAITSEHEDSMNMNISSLHLTDLFSSKCNISGERIRHLLVFPDVMR